MRNTHQPRYIVNDDNDGLKLVPRPHTLEKLAAPVEYLKGTPVDCLCLCVAEEVASYLSEVIEPIYSLYDKGKHSAGEQLRDGDIAYSLYKQGIDYLPLVIEHTHDAGIQFFASFRMNDTHHKSHPDGVLAPEFWKQHPEYRLWGHTDANSYYNAAMNYAIPEIRRRKVELIAECAGKYDVDGVELDFSRTPYLFQPDEAWDNRGLLTAFLREVRDRLTAIGTAKGHSISLMIRTLMREEDLHSSGMDLQTWIDERLPDLLVLTDKVNSLDASIEPWLSRCRQQDIPLYPAIEAGPAMDLRNYHDIVCNPNAPAHNAGARLTLAAHELARRATAQHWLAQGVAGVYLFNFAPRPIPDMYFDPNGARPDVPLRELAQLDTLLYRDKHYLFWRGLPLSVEALRPPHFHQTITFSTLGDDIGSEQSHVILRFRQVAQPFPHVRRYRQSPVVPPGFLCYLLNNELIPEQLITRTRQQPGRTPSGFKLRTHELIEIALPGTALHNGENTLAFHIPKQPTEHDPYVYIYEFEVEVTFHAQGA